MEAVLYENKFFAGIIYYGDVILDEVDPNPKTSVLINKENKATCLYMT